MPADAIGNPILVALDVNSSTRAIDLASQLKDVVGGVKVGSQLFTAEGPSLVRRLVDAGHKVFLDLKYHDIPNTVAQAVEAAVATGAWMVNVHASGGVPMMEAAARAGADAAARLSKPAPLVIAVTVLTSMDEGTLRLGGVERPLRHHVIALAQSAKTAGLSGVVASPLETGDIRRACGPGFVIVTPGIRGAAAGSEKNDQNRTMGPADALKAGASYLVVGRPIIASADPRGAAQAILDEVRAS